MNRDLLIKALIDWNFWYKEQFIGIPRDYSNEVLSLLPTGNAIGILGIKRGGKSTVINQVVKKLIEERKEDPFNILIINFEDSRFSDIKNANDLFYLYELYKEIRKSSGKPYIFLDEVQKVKGWEGFVRSIIDRKEGYVVFSGSTSSVNSKRVRETLAGRYLTVNIYPLSFKEFLKFKGLTINSEIELMANEDRVKSMFQEYLRYGGFPLVTLNNEKEKILSQLYEDIIYKDVIRECNVKKEEELRNLALFYVSNPGNKVNYRRLSRSLKIPLKNVYKYTECLKNSYLISFTRALSPKLSEMLRKERKVYCIDNGISNVVGFRLNENIGGLFENAVYLELQRRYSSENLFYYRGKRGEVDFIVKEGNEVIEAYQASYYLTDMERELEGLKEILKVKKVKSYIITFDNEGEEKVNGEKIKILNSWKWSLGFSN
ncbi:MAG: ATP-binding protein [Sulfolobus sp.]|nr:ATP-binding protein [Sulfolobus sp.]